VTTLKPTADFLFTSIPSIDDAELGGLLDDQGNGLQKILDDLRDRLAQIKEDGTLSPEGKREARREAVKELGDAARVIGQVEAVERLRGRVRTERETLRSPDFRLADDDGEPPSASDGGAEIRRRLERLRETREHGDLAVAELLRDAAESDNRAVLAAIEMDPMREHDPLVPRDVLEEVRQLHIQTRFPERAARLDARARAVDFLKTNLERASEVARELTGEPLFERDSGEFRVLHGDE